MSIALLVGLTLAVLFCAKTARADIYKKDALAAVDKNGVGGGNGILHGRYSFTRDQPPKDHAVKEIGWLTLQPGDSIGVHTHVANEDIYIIISGKGTFTDVDGKTHDALPGDITIARKGQSHGLANTGAEPLIFISVIAEQ